MSPEAVIATYIALGFVAGLMAGVALNWKMTAKSDPSSTLKALEATR